MKVCKYCNSLAYDSERKCKSCGASDFAYQCDNCGAVSSTKYCPTCGMKIGSKIFVCPVCKTRYGTPACPNCGYTSAAPGGSTREQPEKKTTFGTVLLWILFLPIMLLITVWKSKKMAVVWKVLVTCLVAFWQLFPYIYTSIAGPSDDTDEVKTVTQSAEPDEPEATVPAEETSYDITYQNARAYRDELGTAYFQGIVELINTGDTNLALSFSAMDFEDAEGNLLKAEKAVSAIPSVLLPGEKGYLYSQSYYEGDLPDGIKMTVRPKIKQTNDDCVRLVTSDIEMREQKYFGVTILGRVENTTGERQEMVRMAAVLYNENQIPVAIVENYLPEELAACDKVGFEIQSFGLPPTITASNISDVRVYAYPAWTLDSILD